MYVRYVIQTCDFTTPTWEINDDDRQHIIENEFFSGFDASTHTYIDLSYLLYLLIRQCNQVNYVEEGLAELVQIDLGSLTENIFDCIKSYNRSEFNKMLLQSGVLVEVGREITLTKALIKVIHEVYLEWSAEVQKPRYKQGFSQRVYTTRTVHLCLPNSTQKKTMNASRWISYRNGTIVK